MLCNATPFIKALRYLKLEEEPPRAHREEGVDQRVQRAGRDVLDRSHGFEKLRTLSAAPRTNWSATGWPWASSGSPNCCDAERRVCCNDEPRDPCLPALLYCVWRCGSWSTIRNQWVSIANEAYIRDCHFVHGRGRDDTPHKALAKLG